MANGLAPRPKTETGSPALPRGLAEVVEQNGYTDVRHIAGAGWCALLPFAFTHAVIVGLSENSYERRYCYEAESDARRGLLGWDGQNHPGGPWIKCKGAGIDLLNPEFCELESAAAISKPGRHLKRSP